MGLFGGGSKGNTMNKRGKKAVLAFEDRNDFDLNLPGLGGVTYDEKGMPSFTERPELTSARDTLFGGIDPALLGAQSGLGGLQDLSAGYVGAGQDLLGQVGSFDPYSAAASQFEKLDAILQPGRDRRRAAQESILFNQGRLDSTAGARQVAESEAEIERQRQQMLAEQFGNATNVQGSLVEMSNMLGGAGAQLNQGLFTRGLQGLEGAFQTAQPALTTLDTSLALQRADQGRKQDYLAAVQGHNTQQQAIKNASQGGGLGGVLGTIGGSLVGSIGGPIGTAIGGSLGDMTKSWLGGGTQQSAAVDNSDPWR